MCSSIADRLETVVKPELRAREEHGKVAQDFEIKKLEVAAERAGRIASAQATASLFSKMEAKLFGTPEEVNRLLSSMLGGQSVATAADAFLTGADPKTAGMVDGLAKSLGGLAEAASKRLAETGSVSPSSVNASVKSDNHVADSDNAITTLDDRDIEGLDAAENAGVAPAV